MPVVFERKLFKIGEGGVAVTLPKAWINYHGLKPGDKVEIIVSNELMVTTMSRRAENNNTNIDRKNLSE